MENNHQIIDKIRSFNRHYTNVIGLLDQHYLNSPFSLTEGRVLYEIKNLDDCSAKKIREKVTIDEGYLSRIVDKFVQRGLISKIPSKDDRRLHKICLTEKGEEEFVRLNAHSDQLIVQLLEKLSDTQRAELVQMMEKIQSLLDNN